MLELIDHSIPAILLAFDKTINTDNIVYAEKTFALRLRQDKLAQINQGLNVLPFISYFREDHSMGRFNQVLNKRGIPFDGNSLQSGIMTRTPLQPVFLDYEILFWDKDAIRMNELIKRYYSICWRIQNVTIALDPSTNYKFNVLLSSPVDAIYKPPGPPAEGTRNDFYETGQMFIFSFKVKINGVIPDIDHTNSSFRIEKVKVNYTLDQEKIQYEFKVDSNNVVTRVL